MVAQYALTPSGSATLRQYNFMDSGLNNVTAQWYSVNNVDVYTYDASGDHAHDMNYGINDDTEYPDTLRVSINGTDRTTALGGPWGGGGSAVDVTLDVTDYINAAATLQQEHTVQFSCDGGQGEVEVLVELYEVIQTIAVT